MKTPARLTFAALLAAFVGITLPAYSAAVAWSSLHNSDPNFSGLYQSNGVDTLDASFYFDIGTFTAGFTPTGTNLADWSANWKRMDTVGSTDGWSVGDQQVAGYTSFTTSGASESPDANPLGYNFSTGDQIYMWIYNSQTIQQGTEWALITRTYDSNNPVAFNDWIMRDPNTAAMAEITLQDADSVVFGGLNGVQGPGGYDAGNAPAQFDLQTHAVPEPGSALLIAALGVALRLRRGTRRHQA